MCLSIIFCHFPNGPFMLMMGSYIRNVVNILFEMGEEAVLMGAGLFSLQAKPLFSYS